jgi:hypothetical protein
MVRIERRKLLDFRPDKEIWGQAMPRANSNRRHFVRLVTVSTLPCLSQTHTDDQEPDDDENAETQAH